MQSAQTNAASTAAELDKVRQLSASSSTDLQATKEQLSKLQTANSDLSTKLASATEEAAAARKSAEQARFVAQSIASRVLPLPKQIGGLREQLVAARRVATAIPSALAGLLAGEASLEALAGSGDPLLRAVVGLKRAAAAQTAAMQLARSEASAARAERRAIHAELQELKGAVRVFVRVRRPMGKEGDPVVTVGGGAGASGPVPAASGAAAGGATAAASDKQMQSWVEAPVGRRGDSRRRWEFDGCFGPGADQALVWREVRGLVRSALDGYRVCIFAYGQTGAGKTYTMEGDQSTWGKATDDDAEQGENAAGPGEGVVPRAMRMFIEEKRRALDADGTSYSFELAMVEIYCEKLRDLLPAAKGSSGSGTGRTKSGVLPGSDIKLREVSGRGVMVEGLQWHKVETASDAIGLLRRGARARSVGETKMNARSSRSHAVVTLRIVATPPATAGAGAQTLHGEINLVDLAGSERIDRSGAEGQRLKEAQSINTSLSTLGKVINARATNAKHVSYRESALTRLLSASLDSTGGKAALLAAVSPDASSAQETASTLGFAAMAKSVELGKAKKLGSAIGSSASGKTGRGGR